MKDNPAKAKLKAGGTVTAININFAHPGLAEFLGFLGFDIIQMDTMVQAVTDPDVEAFARVCELRGAVPMLRCVPDAERMERYLAYGIQGFHVPNVRSAAEIRKVVDAVKFAPLGKRGQASARANDFGKPPEGLPAFERHANENTIIKAAIEDLEGLAALPEIVKIPELDMVQLGLHDLTHAFGVSDQPRHPKVLEAHEKARAIVQGAGKTFAMGHLIDTPDDIRDAHARGTRYFAFSVTKAIVSGAKEFLDTIKALK